MKLELQKYLESNTPESLTEKYGIAVKRHPKYPNLILFKYSQIESPMSEKIVQESRGIILNEADNWNVVSFPYTKFFNHGEGHAAKIDWNSAVIYEKVDGSLMTLYWYDGKWNVASSGTPDAGGEVNGFNLSFADLFWKTWNELGYVLPTDTDVCYMFELCTQYNKIVVQHKENRIVFHGARNVKFENGLIEYTPSTLASLYGWECIKSFPFSNLEEVLASCKDINPIDGEGYVVCDSNFNRIKLKTPQYVALAHIRDSMSTRRMLEIVRANESSEFLVHFPEYTDLYIRVKAEYDSLISNIEESYEKIKHIEIQKDFALEALKSKCCGALFEMRKGMVKTAKEYVAEVSIKGLMDTLKLREIPLVTLE